jgi:general secretion pathway protein K
VKASEKGASLLTVMMIVALISAVAVGVTSDLTRSIGVARTSGARSDIHWTARSAVLASSAIISSVVVNERNTWPYPQSLAPEPVIVPLEAGEVVITFEDVSNCFNLNMLAGPTGEPDLPTIQAFVRLLEGIGLDQSLASALASAAADWTDADDAPLPDGAEAGWYIDASVPHGTSGEPFVSLSELRAVRGFDPEILAAIRPFLCIGEPGVASRLNLNTLSPEQAVLLPSIFSAGLDIQTAQRLIKERPVAGWQSVDEFLALDDVSRLAEEIRDSTVLSIETSRIRSHMTLNVGEQQRDYTVVFDRQGDGTYLPGRLEEVFD